MTLTSPDLCGPWATIADIPSPCNTYTTDPALLEANLMVASEVLYNLTGQLWPGVCTDTIRPVAAAPVGRGLGPVDMPVWSGQQIIATGGAGLGAGCGCFAEQFGCHTLSTIVLPFTPVVQVVSVKLDGTVLDPAYYRVDDRRRLVFLPGPGVTRTGWPCCQDVRLASTEPDTLEVSYRWGSFPSVGGVNAAATLACQLTLASTDPGSCRLPTNRLQTLTRQGVTAAFLDPGQDEREGGWTGLHDVDMWIGSLRYSQKHRPGAVYDPRRSRTERRIG